MRLLLVLLLIVSTAVHASRDESTNVDVDSDATSHARSDSAADADAAALAAAAAIAGGGHAVGEGGHAEAVIAEGAVSLEVGGNHGGDFNDGDQTATQTIGDTEQQNKQVVGDNKQSVNIENPDDITIRNTPAARAPYSNSTSPCIVGGSAALSLPGFSGSAGKGFKDEECERRATAMAFSDMGVPGMGLWIMCRSAIVEKDAGIDDLPKAERDAAREAAYTACEQRVASFQDPPPPKSEGVVDAGDYVCDPATCEDRWLLAEVTEEEYLEQQRLVEDKNAQQQVLIDELRRNERDLTEEIRRLRNVQEERLEVEKVRRSKLEALLIRDEEDDG